MGKQDHEFKTIAKTRRALAQHRREAETFALHCNGRVKKVDVDENSEVNNSMALELYRAPGEVEIRLMILEAVDVLRREIRAYVLKNCRSFSTSTMFEAIQTLVFNAYQRVYEPMKTVFPRFKDRWDQIRQLMLGKNTEVKTLFFLFRFTFTVIYLSISISHFVLFRYY